MNFLKKRKNLNWQKIEGLSLVVLDKTSFKKISLETEKKKLSKKMKTIFPKFQGNQEELI